MWAPGVQSLWETTKAVPQDHLPEAEGIYRPGPVWSEAVLLTLFTCPEHGSGITVYLVSPSDRQVLQEEASSVPTHADMGPQQHSLYPLSVRPVP